MEVRLTYTLSRASHFDPSCICTPHPLPWRVVTQPLSSDSIQSPPEIMLWHLHVVYSSQKWHAGHKLWWGKAVSQQSAVTGQLVNPARKSFFFSSFSFKTELNQKNVWFLLLVKGAGFALTKEAQDCEMSWGELIFLSDEALQYPEFLHIWVPVPVM